MNDPDISSAAFFEAKYSAAPDADPWGFATEQYELYRYEQVMRALGGQRYTRAFEPGCSVGVLTERLATLCDAVDACDFSPTAAARASLRCATLPGVTVRCAPLSGDESWQAYDLVVLCEIGYYFSAAAWRRLVQRMVAAIRPGTVVLASHWLGRSKDHLQHGDAVHDALEQTMLHPTLSERYQGFRLERWTRKA